MRKHFLLILIIFFLTACGFSPDKEEVKTLINQALKIECPNDFSIVKSYNARAMDDYLEAVIIEFPKESFASLKEQLDLTQWQQNKTEFSYFTKLDGRYSATITLNTNNHKLRYERLHK